MKVHKISDPRQSRFCSGFPPHTVSTLLLDFPRIWTGENLPHIAFSPVFMRSRSILQPKVTSFLPCGFVPYLDAPAQKVRHRPVDGLHSIENKALKISNVFLTLFLVAVQQARSLTVSKVVPVGGESGAQTSSLRPSTDLEVISESGNGSCWKPGTAVPRREGESLCISFLARRCGEGIKSGARKATGPEPRKLFRCSIAARLLGRAPDAIRRKWAVSSH